MIHLNLSVKTELSTVGKIVLRGARIVISHAARRGGKQVTSRNSKNKIKRLRKKKRRGGPELMEKQRS